MNRRGFLASILAAGVAPAAVGSGILMPVRPQIAVPEGFTLARLLRVKAILAEAAELSINPRIIVPNAELARMLCAEFGGMQFVVTPELAPATTVRVELLS